MKKKIQKISDELKRKIALGIDHFDGRAILLFSGGRDSTAVVAAYCNAFAGGQLFLVTVDNGVSSFLDSASRQFAYLKKRYPEVDIRHEVLPCRFLMKQVVINEIERDLISPEYSSLLVCVGCKLVMHHAVNLFAREMNISFILDGFSQRQSHYPEQTPEFMDFVSKMHEKHGVKYLSPLYTSFATNQEVVDYLLANEILFCEQQSVCIFGGAYSEADPEQVLSYLHKCAAKISEVYRVTLGAK